MMNYLFEGILFAVFLAALANSSVKPTEGNNDAKKTHFNNVNYNYYAGPNTKKIEQQLAEMKQEIRALKENQTSCSVNSGLFSEVKQQLAELKQEIRALKVNQTAGCSGGSNLSSDVKQQLAEIKQEIRALKGNQSGCSGGKVYQNCAEVLKCGSKISGVYKIDPDGLGEFEVFCDQKTAGGGWTVFQKRKDGSVDFYRGWEDYKRGFGNLSGDFWLGLDKIHRLTVSSSYSLRVLQVRNGRKAYAEYSPFAVTNERAKYQLSLGKYLSGTGDSFRYYRGRAFSTKDRDNDEWYRNCALSNHGAWWYGRCYSSMYLNGLSYGERTEMKIRPKDF